MSFDLCISINKNNTKNDNSISTYIRRDTHFGSMVQYTSTLVINLQQLKTDLQTQHQHEKNALTELNQRFHIFTDRVQLLQSENLKYLAAIADFRRQFSSINITDSEENYLSLKSNLSTVRDAKIDYEWDFELSQLQIEIYKQRIQMEERARDKRILKLEDELKQSASVLINLRTSNGELQQEVEYLYSECENLSKQYLTLTYDWCNIKKQQQKWNLHVETLKNYIAFYKNLRSNLMQECNSLSISSDDTKQFWKLAWDEVIKRIRHDFKVFYETTHDKMIGYYQTKTKELETDIEQTLHYQQIEKEKVEMIYQTQQVEYEKVQKSLFYEKEIFTNLETTCSKLEAEFKSIQLQHDERFAVQSNDLKNIQENIMIMSDDIDEIRRSKTNLEIEIIIYRQLLNDNKIETIIPRSQPVGNETTRQSNLKNQKKGLITIKECAPDIAYISLINTSTNKTVDISNWILIRYIDKRTKIRYVIPDGIRLTQGSELRIYTKSAAGDTSQSSSYQQLVNNNLFSWGMGDTIETYLFNQNNDEQASYSQSITTNRDNH